MNRITYTQVQELIARLPVNKLPAAYDLLSKLSDEETPAQSVQAEFLSLPLDERRRLLTQQTEEVLAQSHYQETAPEREEWQGGEFSDY
jgi:hypothetical protein